MMKIGYACICLKDDSVRQRTCIQKFASEENLKEIIAWNLRALFNILQYNVAHGILMYRISSDLIPFGSSSINTLSWKTMFQDEFDKIGAYIKQHHLRVSMHPGQYTLLNALNTDIIERAILDLQYHCDVLDAMHLDAQHKLILHIGGVYGDKQAAMQRFIHVYKQLSQPIKQRLVIENDDRYYNVEDVLYISSICHIPVVFDNLHHEILPSLLSCSLAEVLSLVKATWKQEDGVQKIHYCQQDPTRRIGAHARFVHIDPFLSFLHSASMDMDIMLEVKDKNRSACKVHYILDVKDDSFYEEWNTYRYIFYLHSMAYYASYDSMFAQHKAMDRYEFYTLVEQFMASEVMKENYRTLCTFIKLRWYEQLLDRNKKIFDRYLKDFQEGTIGHAPCLAGLYRIAQREKIQEGIDALMLLVEV